MKNAMIYIYCVVLLFSCNVENKMQPPVWNNPSDTLSIPHAMLEFRSKEAEWEATLYSVVQPMRLGSNWKDQTLRVSLESISGITEGHGHIELCLGQDCYYYPVYLENEEADIQTGKDYRSPKTVNPDSSLLQQRLIHQFDAHRNLVFLDAHASYFYEEVIELSPKAGIYRAVEDDVLSSYYVQPGSCATIPIHYAYNKSEQDFKVIAGPMVDVHQNTVAEGTRVVFIYTDNLQTYRREAVLQDGYASINLPAQKHVNHYVWATVNETHSSTIKLPDVL